MSDQPEERIVYAMQVVDRGNGQMATRFQSGDPAAVTFREIGVIYGLAVSACAGAATKFSEHLRKAHGDNAAALFAAGFAQASMTDPDESKATIETRLPEGGRHGH